MYTKQEWNNGTRLDAFRLNHIEEGIYNCDKEIEQLKSAKTEGNLVTEEELFRLLSDIREDYNALIDKQKKEITALKSKVTKLSKKEVE